MVQESMRVDLRGCPHSGDRHNRAFHFKNRGPDVEIFVTPEKANTAPRTIKQFISKWT